MGARQNLLGRLGRFRNPEYTGENRCLPCTVLNAGIAIVLSIAVAIVSIPGAVVLFGACVVVITLRGYLVPGTPQLVQYLPDRVHEAIGPDHGADTVETSVDIERTLKSAGIVRECEDVDDFCLTEQFHEAFDEQIARLDDESLQRERLGTSLSVPVEEVQLDRSDGRVTVVVDDIRAGTWQSNAAFLADLASERLLSSWLPDWEQFPARDRTQLLVALRTFVETCPSCGGDVLPDEDVVRTCCRDDVVSVTTACADCGDVVFKGTDK